jgi:isopentenyl-diphosphate Delta-isomerase
MQKSKLKDTDNTMIQRKKDHIDMAFESRVSTFENDPRFRYEPVMSAHPKDWKEPVDFLGKKLQVPIWISSMTGGTGHAHKINHNLACVCNEFGMGLGLGSCRILLSDMTHLDDFNVRDILGDHLPLYANLGISQVEKMIKENETGRIKELIELLRADGLIVHVNPLQEWMQPEGDRIDVPPVKTIETLLPVVDFPVIVKEVGQGMGPESLQALLRLPLGAVEFGAFGGTNFSRAELKRRDDMKSEKFLPFAFVGEDALKMTGYINEMDEKEILCKNIIISGGIRDFLDGHYFTSKLKLPSIYGQASTFLKYALQDYDMLKKYAQIQVEGLALARAYLRII